MKTDLETIRDRYKALLERPEDRSIRIWKETADESLSHFDVPGYREVTPYVERLSKLDHRMACLLLLLRNYARPMPIAPEEIPDVSAQHYERYLNKRRPDRETQNEADAMNLASLDALDHLDPSTESVLITATGPVLAANKNVRDPMFFVLTAIVFKEFPEWEQRDKRLRIMIGRLYSILHAIETAPEGKVVSERSDRDLNLQGLNIGVSDETTGIARIRREVEGSIHHRTSSAPGIKRFEVEHFTAAVAELRNDAVLIQLADIMAQATQSARNAMFQSNRVARDIQLLRQTDNGGGVFSLIDHLVASLEGVSEPGSKQKNLSWKRRSDEFAARNYDFRDEHQDINLEGQLLRTGIAIAWTSFESLDDFFLEATKVVHLLRWDNPIVITVRLAGKIGTIVHETINLASMKNALTDIADETKIALLRIDLGTVRLWFDPGDMYAGTQNPANWRKTRIAAQIYRQDAKAAVSGFIARTASQALSDVSAIKACRDLWQVHIAQN